MKQFWSVLRFELSGFFKNKTYLLMTALLITAVIGVLSYPSIKGMLGKEQETPAETAVTQVEQLTAAVPDGADVIAIANENSALDDTELLMLAAALQGKTLRLAEDGADTVRDKVADGEYIGAIILESPQSAVYIARNLSLTDTTASLLYQAVIAIARYETLKALEIPETDAAAILNPSVSVSVEDLGVSQTDTFFYTYVMLMALYMAIVIYGQLVATSVATEKSSRTMELLITSARPNSLLFGKMIASALSGLIQIGLIFGSAVLFYHLNAASWAGNEMIASIFNMPLAMVGYVLLFFVLGFFLYAFMFGAIGSLVSRVEDVSTSIMPILICYIAAFVVVINAITSGNLNSPLLIACSYIPLTSPMAMFTRVAMASPAWYEVVVSIALLMATTAGIGVLSASIYRMGVLMYGKKPSPAEILKVIRMTRKKGA